MKKFALQKNEFYAKFVASGIESILNHELGGFALPVQHGFMVKKKIIK